MSNLIHRAVVIGASGLVGKQLIYALNELSECEQICLLLRRAHPELAQLEKVQQIILPNLFDMDVSHVQGFSHAFSCLGTTLKQAGSKSAFYQIDYAMNAHFAQLLRGQDTHLLLVSALGANDKSLFFYNRVKGELEQQLQFLNLTRVSIFRPSLLLGQRHDARLMEDLSQRLFQRFSPFIPQTFAYKPVTAEQVAHTMVLKAQTQTEKWQIYDNLAIQQTQ